MVADEAHKPQSKPQGIICLRAMLAQKEAELRARNAELEALRIVRASTTSMNVSRQQCSNQSTGNHLANNSVMRQVVT
ncbi:hypothetical protein AMTR_s00008p00128050 [Amborella trichopoda]|uniref:Uncharacterized protein n=1 Tax=Amborella trichopoda TaxID=13333 RepID=W1NJB3_AMBTC|nr:hypothetical protein AMTR_s00008p00128050 [Amborella trichopoda]